jgi:hypothetical protein
MQIPIPTGMPFPQMPMIQGKSVRLQNKIIPSSTNNIIRLQDKVIEAVKEKTVQLQSKISESVNERNKIIMQTVSEKKQQAALTILEGVYKRAEDVLVEFAAGEAIHAKQWMASEKTTSLITYNTAIEGYDIGTYDYSTGDGVSYTLNLAVRDIKIEYPA